MPTCNVQGLFPGVSQDREFDTHSGKKPLFLEIYLVGDEDNEKGFSYGSSFPCIKSDLVNKP